MKVLNLQCSHRHSFEGWFGSEDEFQVQLGIGLIECPLCADKEIQKMPSAPRLNLGGQQPQEAPVRSLQETRPAAPVVPPRENDLAVNLAAVTELSAGPSPSAQGAFLKALRHVMAQTEDVGRRFADEARRMHYGEAEERSIRGQTSAREALELLEEGIDVVRLPLPPAIKETLQ